MDRWDTAYDTMAVADLFESRGGRIIELSPHSYGFRYSRFEGRFKLKPDLVEGKMWDAFSSGHSLCGLVTDFGVPREIPVEDVRRYDFRIFSYRGGVEQVQNIFVLADMSLEDYIRSLPPPERPPENTDKGVLHFLPGYTWHAFVNSACDEDRDTISGYGCLLECLKLGAYYAAFRLLDILL